MTTAEARAMACRLAIRLIEPLDSLVYTSLEETDRSQVDREIREIKTWLRLRAGEPAAKTKAK